MEIKKENKRDNLGIRFAAVENGKELGVIYLHLIKNDSHKEPYGLLEDLLVDEKHRGKGVGTKLVEEALAEAKRLGCYKILATSRMSRPHIHEWYEKLGFKKWGFEFRMDFK